MNGTSSHIDGPNCWNGALVATGVMKHFRFIDPKEWLLSLKESCTETEVPREGSVGRLFHPKEGEVHGFVHLNENTVFQKLGEDKMHGYQIVSYKEMLNQYGKSRNCRIDNRSDPECFHILKYYNCHAKESIDPLQSSISENLERLLFSEETRYSFRVRCEGEEFQARENYLLNIKEALLKISASSNTLNQLDQAFLSSLRHQLYNIRVSNRNFKCSDRRARDKLIREVTDLVGSLQE